jgi:hypothetical protein
MNSSIARILCQSGALVERSPFAIEDSSVAAGGGQPVLDRSFHLRLSVDALFMHPAIQLHLSQSSKQPNQLFAGALFAFRFLGSIHPHHMSHAKGALSR